MSIDKDEPDIFIFGFMDFYCPAQQDFFLFTFQPNYFCRDISSGYIAGNKNVFDILAQLVLFSADLNGIRKGMSKMSGCSPHCIRCCDIGDI